MHLEKDPKLTSSIETKYVAQTHICKDIDKNIHDLD